MRSAGGSDHHTAALLRWRIYSALEPPGSTRHQDRDGSSPRIAYLVEALLVGVILINSASLILWTVPSLKHDYVFWFHVIEFCTIAVFLAEYALRFWTAPEANPGVGDWGQRWRYARSPSALIDALALIPSAAAVVVLLVAGDSVSLSFLLAVRLITRSAKLARYFPGGRRLGMAMRQKGSQLLTTVAGLIFVLVIAASLMFFAESNAQPDKFNSIPAAMWWSVVTLTTVGYGDTVPVTTMGRLLAAVIAVLGIGLFAPPAGILSAGLLEADVNDGVAGGQRNTGSFCPHCGQPLTAGDADHRPGSG